MKRPAIIDASDAGLRRFAALAGDGRGRVGARAPLDRALSWSAEDRSGTTETTQLRAGLRLHRSTVRWRTPWTLSLPQAATEVKLVIARGASVLARWSGEAPVAVDALHFFALSIERESELQFEFAASPEQESAHEQIALELDRRALARMLGVRALPSTLDAALVARAPRARFVADRAVIDARDALLDLHADGPRRALHLEARAVALVAAMVDVIDVTDVIDAPRAMQAPRALDGAMAPAHDDERLERAREILLSRLDAPPTIAALSRLAGINEVKLKRGFRERFGSTVFGYLRAARMERAYALLRGGALSVTEVAQQVGYTNPSKFTAAFRAHFGERPSHVRG